jgi:hypothetical protein
VRRPKQTKFAQLGKTRSDFVAEFRRKLYRRGSSFETTVPMPLLFKLDLSKKHDVIFKYDVKSERWYLEFEERKLKRGKK